ncbi:hypothetical protein RHMOL_Rhmol11G0123600 [Rhododendron molle]|uniref:Uncharacterized protein n=1 Tax=Rhododendron molle TaxID=49168 RepID=A0ACC0LSB5_RHOML|nr:hypothetical protein RHMOL_Rhmol11G0123600 [Rhododendron molle]
MYQSFHMSKTNFFALYELLETRYGLEEGERISVQEQVAIFLWIVGQRANNRNAQERFQHSGETIFKRFHNNCIGAIDGTHIKAHPDPKQLLRWINRKGYPTQNIMAACNFDIRIFNDCLRNPVFNFPAPRGG